MEKRKEDLLNLKLDDLFADKELVNFIEKTCQTGCVLTLVGGAVRDYLLYGKMSQDLDFEFRGENSNLFKKEFPHLKFEDLSFGIIKTQIGNWNIELAPPRKEIYDPQCGPYGHSDFKAEIIFDLTYQESFARRDFSVNAIGIEITQDGRRFIDPYEGFEDLSAKSLKPISEEFFLDPVRYLRLIRFSIQLNFNIHNEIQNAGRKFDLEKLTGYYFKLEGEKVDFCEFCTTFYAVSKKLDVKLGSHLSKLNFLGHLNFESKFIQRESTLDIKKLFKCIFFFNQIQKEEVKDLCFFPQLSSQWVMATWAKSQETLNLTSNQVKDYTRLIIDVHKYGDLEKKLDKFNFLLRFIQLVDWCLNELDLDLREKLKIDSWVEKFSNRPKYQKNFGDLNSFADYQRGDSQDYWPTASQVDK